MTYYNYKIPSYIELIRSDNNIYLNGPKGQVKLNFLTNSNYEYDETQHSLKIASHLKKQLDKKIKGISLGFKIELELIGIGYRAQLINNYLKLRIGFSHDVFIAIPENIKLFLESEKLLICYSCDYELLTNFCAQLINKRPINMFTGQGIKIKGSVSNKIQRSKKK